MRRGRCLDGWLDFNAITPFECFGQGFEFFFGMKRPMTLIGT
jgi:hypothetical protein